MWNGQRRTEFPAPNFFSVPMTAPLLCAALRADLPLTTVSRAAPPPRVLVPIFVTVSQSSMIMVSMCLTVKPNSRAISVEARSCLCAGVRCLFVVDGTSNVEIRLTEFGGEAVAHNCACRVNQTLSLIGSRSR